MADTHNTDKETMADESNSAPPAVSAGVHIHPRLLAHLGDAVYELHIRELALQHTDAKKLEHVHKFTTARVNGAFQCTLLEHLTEHLNDAEHDIVRRGRNIPVATKRRHEHKTHRLASGFEALVGYLHLKAPERLNNLLQNAHDFIVSTT